MVFYFCMINNQEYVEQGKALNERWKTFPQRAEIKRVKIQRRERSYAKSEVIFVRSASFSGESRQRFRCVTSAPIRAVVGFCCWLLVCKVHYSKRVSRVVSTFAEWKISCGGACGQFSRRGRKKGKVSPSFVELTGASQVFNRNFI